MYLTFFINISRDKKKVLYTMLIDPFKITNFNRSDAELEAFLLFCVCVAGKKATMIASKIADFLALDDGMESPFKKIDKMISEDTLTSNLQKVKMGKYALLTKAFSQIVSANFNLKTVTALELEKIPGVGKKTSRFFILHSRIDANVAVIDTHVLKYLNSIGVNAGKAVPSGAKYDEFEQIMLSQAIKHNMDPADFDLKIWSWYASGAKGKLEFAA